MEISEENLKLLSGYLYQTMSPDVTARKQAEQFLMSIENNKNYALLLLYTIDKPTFDMPVRLCAAIMFKNFIKRNWPADDENDDKIDEEDRVAVKRLILNLMLNSDQSIKRQLSDAISIIGKYDFPHKWSNVLKEMIEKFQTLDFSVINGVLYTAHSLFKKYRYEFKSQKLWTEIKFVLDTLTAPLTALFEEAMKLIYAEQKRSPDELLVVYNTILLICKIFYSLNFQDLPEFFEDNMALWMKHFHVLLVKDIPSVFSPNDDEAGILEQIKSQICENVNMYAQKYGEEFGPFLPNFVTDIWNLLRSINMLPKYDILVSNALQFLATVAERHQYQHLFADPAVLSGICEKVIIPNIEIRAADEELFNDNPGEYIRRDIEGSDVDTRRRSACDLVKVLSRYFQDRITGIIGPYIQEMLSRYDKNAEFWRAKDTALYLVTSLASLGQTEKHGVTQTNNCVNLIEFAHNHIITELQKPDVNAVPVVKADCIKYIMCFRTVLPKQAIVTALPLIIKCLEAESVVVHTYAAAAIERVFQVKDPNGGGPLIRSQELNPLIGDLITKLIGVISKSEYEENEYAMKAVMRTFAVAQEGVVPFLSDTLPQLINIMKMVAKNPSKPNFNHYLFETMALCVRIVYKVTPVGILSLENELFPVFQIILQGDVSEFIPYVFQLLAMLLEYHNANDITPPYLALYTFLVVPQLWDRSGNVYPLVKLINAYIKKCQPDKIDDVLKLTVLLGIFQKLLFSRVNDHEAFNMIRALIECCPPDMLALYMKQIFILVFQRLTSSKTTKYVQGVVKFFCFYLLKYGASNLITTMDSIQARIFEMVAMKVIIPGMESTTNYYDVKVISCGVIKLLTEAEEVYNGNYSHLWIPLLQGILKMFESPNAIKQEENDLSEEVEEITYDPACSKLVYANNLVRDPLPDVGDVRILLAQALSKLSASVPGKLMTAIASGLTSVEAEVLQKYMTVASVQIM